MEDIMVAVTLFATGGIGIVSQQRLSMYSSHIIGHFHDMATPTVDRFQFFGMGKPFIGSIGMTGETAVAVVDRLCKDGGIHKHGYGSSIKHSG
jgi:hypothetical protein